MQRTAGVVAYSAIAANDRAPVSTAHAPNSGIVDAAWRIPRAFRGFQTLSRGVQVETVPTLFSGEISALSLPARRTTELIIHHDDLDTTWEWHEADPEAILDAIEVCVRRLQINPASPGLQIIAGEGEEWTVGDGSYRIEGYYEELLPLLARGRGGRRSAVPG